MLGTDPFYYPNRSKRTVLYAQNGMVATSQPLAAQVGLRILQQGGNAIDAAIATAASLTVLEPTSNGIGGDSFALVWRKGKLYGLNCSGSSPATLSAELVKDQGHIEMPKLGWLPVTVPGAPKGWAKLIDRFGKLTLLDCLRPAIDYAKNGYPVSPETALAWSRAYRFYKENLLGEQFEPWFATFAPKARAPEAGEIWGSLDMAESLREIGETNAQSFYKGGLAEKIVQFSQKKGGYLKFADLADYDGQWVDPISINYRGYDIWEIPPNGQGLITLLALNILQNFSLETENTRDFYHKQIEALKLAFVDGLKYISDPQKIKVPVTELLSSNYAKERSKLIGDYALEPQPGSPAKGGTVYLATADREGNMVSYIQSNYMGFGSGLVVPGTGISLQNRGHTFSLDPNHVNYLEPSKKTYHTIIPGFVSKAGKPVGPFGVMGGFMQPQGHLQLIINSIDLHLNPQAALDMPRWQWLAGKKILVEPEFPNHLAEALERRGHIIEKQLGVASFGRGQAIWRDYREGVLLGGSDPRADGQVTGW